LVAHTNGNILQDTVQRIDWLKKGIPTELHEKMSKHI